MKKPCKKCSCVHDVSDLIRCQSKRHRVLGDAFCTKCAKKYGPRFCDPFYCVDCHPDTAKKPKQRKPKPKVKPKQSKPRKSVNTRLSRLRAELGLGRVPMAQFIGMSHRNYLDREKDDGPLSDSTKKLCWYVCMERAPDLVHEWPEGEDHRIKTEGKDDETTEH